MTGLILFVAAQGATVLPYGDWGALPRFAAALLLGLLCLELTVRAGGSIWPAVIVHFLYDWSRLAFVDPRMEEQVLTWLAMAWAPLAAGAYALAKNTVNMLAIAVGEEAFQSGEARSQVELGLGQPTTSDQDHFAAYEKQMKPVVFRARLLDRIAEEFDAERCRAWAIEQSGWAWLGKYKTDFLLQAPVSVAVVGDPKKSGMDMFQKEGAVGYQLACAAAIQNMMLAAHALDLGSDHETAFFIWQECVGHGADVPIQTSNWK